VNAYIGFQSIAQPIPGLLEVKISLEPHPECFGGAKIAGQAQCSIRGNGSFAMNNFIDTAGRDWSLIRMLCCPFRFPRSASSRFAGGTRKSFIDRALFSILSFRH
jgi:hypothetical protein